MTGSFPERSETFIYRKAVGLAKRGHQVTLATRQIGDWSLYPTPLPATLHVERLPADDSLSDPRTLLPAARATLRAVATSPRGMREVIALARARGPARHAARLVVQHMPFVDRDVDVIHFEFLALGTMYPLIRDVAQRPIVVSCRGSDINNLEDRPAEEREAAIECLRAVDAIHCVSEAIASQVTRITGRRDGIWVNRPAIDTAEITFREPSLEDRPLRLVATGRLVWKKGFDYLLAALARLARRGVAFEAEILGDGELRSVLRYSIEDLGLARHVSLPGGVSSSEVLARMRRADVFVLSSVQEGISNAVLEAMAIGLPIVTTNAGGMAEAVADGVEGFVVDVRDPDAIAERIERLAREPATRQAMGRAARARAERDFDLTRQLDVFEKLYASLRTGAS